MKALKYILLFSLVLLASYVFCQGPGFPSADGGEPCGGPFTPPCPVPLDGGIGFLIAAGVAYGGKKFHDRNKKVRMK